MSDQKRKTVAQAIYSEYSLGDGLLEGWWAQPSLDPSGPGILVHRNGRVHGLYRDGQETRGGQFVLDQKKGIVTVGDYCLPFFDVLDSSLNLLPGHAEKLAVRKGEPRKYMVEANGKRSRLVEGEVAAGLGLVSVLPNGHLQIGRSLIPVAPKSFEIMLLAQPKREMGGYLAYMNLKQPGSGKNMKDGIRGVYYPSQGSKPAHFSELGDDGDLYVTAKFWSTESKGSKAPPSDEDKTKIVAMMEALGVPSEQARADVEDACRTKGATFASLKANIDYCKDRAAKAVAEGKQPVRPAYVSKAIREGFVPHGPQQSKFANVQCRTLAAAMEERRLYREITTLDVKLSTIKEDVAIAGIEGASITDHPLYDPTDPEKLEELKARFKGFQEKSWKNYLFTFLVGQETVHRIKKEAQPAPGSIEKGP